MNRYKRLLSAISIFGLFASSFLCLAQEVETKAPAEAVRNWQDLRYGMFIHWGPVSLRGTEIGWSRAKEVPQDDYDSLYKEFNPVLFNADEWAKAAKDAGMKYMVLVTKHHDGFCLWGTKQTDHNIMNSPFARDVTKELAEACKKQGIKFGTYYSTCDWYNEFYPKGSPGGKTVKPTADMAKYDQYLRAQTAELLRNYGPLVTMWFDVPQVYGPEFGIKMVNDLRKIQPDLMINNRAHNGGETGRGSVGDYDTPEQKIGGFNRDRAWETCMTICHQWAWKPNDSMKPLKQCIQTLVTVNGGDGNFLFNVGPMPDGRIEQRQIVRLAEMGKWLEKYGESVYGTRGGPFKPAKWGAATCKGSAIYVHVFEQSMNEIKLPAIDRKVKSAKLLAGGEVAFTQNADGLVLAIPAKDMQEIDTVVKLDVDGDAFSIAPVDVAAKTEAKSAK